MALHSGGVKLGDRIVALVTKAIVATHSKLVHTKHRLAMLVFSDISDIISEEVHKTAGTMLSQLHSGLDPDSPAHPLMKFMAEEHGQLQAFAGASAIGQGLLWPVSALINNELAPVVYESVATNPHSIPDAGAIADAHAKEWIDDNSFHDGMAKNGINSAWADMLSNASQSYPDVSVALDLLRRGEITEDDLANWVAHNGTPRGLAGKMRELADVPLSPADAALAVLRGNMTQVDGAAVASKWGVSANTFQALIDNTGEPPGTEQLLEAHRRGYIDDTRLVKGILESRVRDEWVDVLRQLAYVPMSTADAVNAVVQNHISEAQGEQIANDNGLQAGMFPIMVETAGAPLSRTEMEQLFNRGLVTKDDVTQALRESRLKNKYNDLAFSLHERLLEPRELADAVLWGAITHQDAVHQTMELGYSQASSEILVSSAVNRKMESQRLAVVRSIETLYEDNALSKDQASQSIAKMGFEPTEVDLILQAAELRRNAKLINAGLSAIRSKFVGHHIERVAASGLIDQMGIPHQQRDALLQLWQVEHDANVRLLTPSQVIKANTLGFYTDDETLQYLKNLGFDDKAANALIGGA